MIDEKTREELMEEAKAFWLSPIGRQRIQEARTRDNPILKKQNYNNE